MAPVAKPELSTTTVAEFLDAAYAECISCQHWSKHETTLSFQKQALKLQCPFQQTMHTDSQKATAETSTSAKCAGSCNLVLPGITNEIGLNFSASLLSYTVWWQLNYSLIMYAWHKNLQEMEGRRIFSHPTQAAWNQDMTHRNGFMQNFKLLGFFSSRINMLSARKIVLCGFTLFSSLCSWRHSLPKIHIKLKWRQNFQ